MTLIEAPKKIVRRVRRERERSGMSPVARRVGDERLTYLSYRSVRNIERCVRAVATDRIPGMLLEAGMALGGSAIIIASLMQQDGEFRGYDVFGMIPPPSDKDDTRSHERYAVIASGESQGLRGDRYYGYEEDLYGKDAASFERYDLPVGDRITLHKGLFEDTLRLDGPVAFAHLDCDWYDPVRLCLERIYPVLSPGGFIVSDDYHHYGGCTRAVDEFLADHPDLVKVEDAEGPPDHGTNLVLRKR